MDSGAIAGIVVVGIILVVAAMLAWNSMYIVHQAECIVIERLGKFHRVLTSGLHFTVPFLDRPRSFTWRRTFIAADSTMRDENTNNYRIDLRESLLNLLPTQCFSRDTILIDVNSLMFFRIEDVRKAIYEVDDLQSAVVNVAQTQLKEVFGHMTFSEAMASQSKINSYMKEAFGPRFKKWGLRVERMELLDMKPKANISESMKKQMVAERERRGEFIRAEGNKAAMRLKSEGTKRVKFTMGVAEQEATRKRSEGQANATVQLAHAESTALDTVAAMIAADNCSQTDYMVAQRYLEFFRNLGSACDNKTVYLPYDVNSMRGLVRTLPSAYGRATQSLDASMVMPSVKEEAAENKDEFGDL